MPKLWSETIAVHRREVRDAILDATVALVAEHGPTAITMSQIAQMTGIGRATLYKYFPDVESILVAWHEREVNAHLEQLTQIRDQPGTAGERLANVLEAYALIAHESRDHHGAELGAFAARLHRENHHHEGQHHHDQHRRGNHVTHARHQLLSFIRDLLTEAAAAGDVRNDVSPDELARFCHHALAATGDLPSKAAVHRLVMVTLAGLRPPR